MSNDLRRTACAVAAFFVSAGAVLASDTEVIMRTDMEFSDCPSVIEGMLSSLQANTDHVHLLTDTGAHYQVKLVSRDANLVFLCNAVSNQITVTRTMPGELVTAAN